MRFNRSSPTPPTRTPYNTPKDSPRDAPANPVGDQNSQKDLPVPQTGQTESQVESLTGDRETSQPESSVPATATDPADVSYTEQEPGPNPEIRQFQAERHLDPLVLWALVKFIADPAPQTETKARGVPSGTDPEALSRFVDREPDILRSYMQSFSIKGASPSGATEPLRQSAPAGDPDEVAQIENVLSAPDRPTRLQEEPTVEAEKADVPTALRQDDITRAVNK